MQDGQIDFSEFVYALSLCCVGKKDEKTKCTTVHASRSSLWCTVLFDMYDIDGDGYINPYELTLLLKTAMGCIDRLGQVSARGRRVATDTVCGGMASLLVLSSGSTVCALDLAESPISSFMRSHSVAVLSPVFARRSLHSTHAGHAVV